MKYDGTVLSNTLKVVGIDLVAAGEIDADGKIESIVIQDDAAQMYRKLVVLDNIMIGAILFGDIRGSEQIQSAIKAKRDIASLKKDLADIHFDFNRLK